MFQAFTSSFLCIMGCSHFRRFEVFAFSAFKPLYFVLESMTLSITAGGMCRSVLCDLGHTRDDTFRVISGQFYTEMFLATP